MRKYKSLLWMGLVLGLAGCEPQSRAVAEKPMAEYVVGSSADYAPFEWLDAQRRVQGFDVEVLRAVAAREGFAVRFVHRPWRKLFASLQQGDCDILASAVSVTEDRQRSMGFSEPYFQTHQLMALRQGVGAGVSVLQDLKGRRVAVLADSTAEAALGQALGGKVDGIVQADSLPSAMKDLEAGKLEAVVGDEGVLRHFASDRMVLRADASRREAESYAFAVRKGEDALLAKLNAGLRAIREDGSYEAIRRRYFPG